MAPTRPRKKYKRDYSKGRAKKPQANIGRFAKSKQNRSLNQFASNRSPVPLTAKTKLVYFGNGLTLDFGGALNQAAHVFCANGLYDTDVTGTGHQPLGFDQFMLLYDHYVVIGAKITVFVDNKWTSPMTVGIAVMDDATTLSNHRYWEYDETVMKMLGSTNGERRIQTISAQVNPNKFLGIFNPMSEAKVEGDDAANPTDKVFFHVFAGTVDGSAVTTNPRFAARLEFQVVFKEPKQLAKS